MDMMDPQREHRILELLTDYPSVIRMFKPEETTEEMWKIAIENEPSLFQYIDHPSHEMVVYALSQDGANLRYLPKLGIQMTPEYVYTAVDNYPGAIFMVPDSLWSTKLKEFACSRDSSLMRDIPMNRHYIESQLKRDPTLVRFLPNPTEEQLCNAIDSNPSVCAYITEFTPRMVKLIQAKYPDVIPLIPTLRKQIADLNAD